MASQSSSYACPSNLKSKAQDHDYLTNLPPEVLLKVIAQVPSNTYLDLVHTSRFLRTFLKLNASQICNEGIRSRYPLEAKILETTKEAGWLVPTNTKLKEEEEGYTGDNRLLNYTDRKYFTLLGDAGGKEDVRISLMSPGPQYIYFLEQGLVCVWSEKELKALQSHVRKVWGDRGDLLKVVIEGKVHTFSIWGPKSAKPDARQRFRDFVKGLGRRLLRVEGGRVLPPSYRSKCFPRELVWFYGVDRLWINVKYWSLREESNKDWKKLPMSS